MTRVYTHVMSPSLPVRTIRVSDDLWLSAHIAARLAGTTVSAVVTKALHEFVAAYPEPPPPEPPPQISLGELREQVAALTLQGLTADAIAARLNVSARTVKRHRAHTGTPGSKGPGGPPRRWTAYENDILADTSLSAPQVAAQLHRPVESVYQRRYEKGITIR